MLKKLPCRQFYGDSDKRGMLPPQGAAVVTAKALVAGTPLRVKVQDSTTINDEAIPLLQDSSS